MTCFFTELLFLTSFPDLSKFNLNKNVKLNKIFKGCISLNSLPDFSKLNIDLSKEENIDECFSILNK